MGVQSDETSVSFAAQQILTPRKEEQAEETVEQTNPEEETLEVTDEVREEEVSGEEDEVVGDSDEDEDTVEDQTDTEYEADTDNETSDEDFYTVKVDGEEYEVNLDELKKGYQLEKNYTKKRMALTEKEAAIAETEKQLNAEREKYLQVTAQLAQEQQQELVKAQQKLEAMDRETDPVGYVTQQLEVQEIANGIESKRKAWEAAQTQQQQANQQRMQQYLTEQSELLKAQLPEWENAEYKNQITSYAESIGLSPETISSISEAAAVIALDKARRYDELQKQRSEIKKKKTSPKAKPVVRSKAKRSEGAVKAQKTKRKKQTLKQTGRVGDAAALIYEAFNK